MNKNAAGFGILLIVSAVTAWYFSDLTIRIAAGGAAAIGLGGAIWTLVSQRRSNDTDETSEADDTQPASRDAAGGSDAGQRDADASGAQQAQRAPSPRTPRIHRGAEIPEQYYRGEAPPPVSDDPRAEFDYVTQQILTALKDHLIAHSVALFWINTERQQLVIGPFVSDSKGFTTARRLALGTDLVSQAGVSGKPVLLADIVPSSEQDLIPYYDAREGVQSFVAVPVYFDDEPIAAVVADSMAPDAFGVETVASIGRFTSIISLLLAGFNQKFNLSADAKLLATLGAMRRSMQSVMDPYGVASAAAAAAADVLDWDYMAVILFNNEKRCWSVVRSQSRAASLPYVSEGVTVSMDGSVLRPALDEQDARIIASPKQPAYRFHEKETIASQGEICAAPILTPRRCLGLLVVEYREGSQYGSRDITVLNQIADMAGLFLDAQQTRELARKHLLIDEATRVSSRTFLLQRLNEEHARMRKASGEAVFFLIGLDNPEEVTARYGQDGLDEILAQLGQVVRGTVQIYDVLGRFDSSRFGLLMLHTGAEDAYLRGEKIRKAIAGLVLSQDGTSFSVTASLAGCAFSEGRDLDHVLRVCEQAMNLAVGDGGNCVKVV